MNCKPNDLAVVVKATHYQHVLGRVVTTLNTIPPGIDYKCPNGFSHLPLNKKFGVWWMCKFQNPIAVLMSNGKWRDTFYAPVPDDFLRPIRDPGDDATDETLEWLPVPVKETA